MFTQKFRFYKENGLWYVDLPDFPGPKEALLMVEGADGMLDKLSLQTNEVTLEVSVDPNYAGDPLKLIEILPEGGAIYYADLQEQKMWLCDVMLYVFGQFPPMLYFTIANNVG